MTNRTLRIDVVVEATATDDGSADNDHDGDGADPAGTKAGAVADLRRHLSYLGAEVMVHGRTADWSAGLRSRWLRRPPDVVYAQTWSAGHAALAAARPLALPVALTLRDRTSDVDPGSDARSATIDLQPDDRSETETLRPPPAVERRLARAVDLLVATSRMQLVELGVPTGGAGHAVVVPLGVDLEGFRPRGLADAKRPEPAPSGGRLVVLSRLQDDDGCGDVLRAAAMMRSVELVVAGPGTPLTAGQLRRAQALRVLATDLGLRGRFDLLETVERRLRPELLRTADVVACCPRTAPPLDRVIEAMACAVPVVASGAGALGEVVEHGRTGIRVHAGQPDAIAAAITRLLVDAELRATVTRTALRRSSAHGWHTVAAQTYGHLAALAARGTGAVALGGGGRSAAAGPRRPAAVALGAAAPPALGGWLAADAG